MRVIPEQACSWPVRRQSFAIWDIFHDHSVTILSCRVLCACLLWIETVHQSSDLGSTCDTPLYIVATCLSPLSDPRIVLEERLCSPHTWMINLLINISLKLIINHQSTPPDEISTQGLVVCLYCYCWNVWFENRFQIYYPDNSYTETQVTMFLGCFLLRMLLSLFKSRVCVLSSHLNY